MCGIFGYIGNRTNAAQIVFSGLKDLEYRGYDSWGVVVNSFNKNIVSKLFVKKRVGKIGEANVDTLPSGSIAIGHTRWATHGGITKLNAHPHLDCQNNIAVIHNGIFENYESIKNGLIKAGHKFVSETDSEVISHMLEVLTRQYSLSYSLKIAFAKMEGLNAIVAISRKCKEIVAVRNGSPLVIGFGEKENYLASDVSSILPFTNKVYFLEENDVASIMDKKINIFSATSGRKKKIKTQNIHWKGSETGKGNFENYMLKEIYEQPKIISEIARTGVKPAKLNANLIKSARGSYLVGCGTASYACLAGQYLFSKIAGYHINFAIGSEFGYHLDFLNNESLVIPVSQSGETMDILESVKKAKEKNARISCLVNVIGSSLFRISDYQTLIGAGPEKAVASSKALTAMISHLILTACALNGNIKTGQKILKSASKSVNNLLSKESIKSLRILANIIHKSNDIYVIGRGLSYPAALEGALKIKEISYIHAEGLAAGELKHGPLALIEKGTPSIAFLPNDETYGANLAGAMEMKARGGYIIGISFKDHEVFDYFIKVRDAKEASIIPNIVAVQLLAYFLATKKGLDPDKPRNLAKSVTVK